MTLDALLQSLPPYAKDVRLNFSSLGREETLTAQQRDGLLVACGLASRNPDLARALEAEAAPRLSPAALAAAKAAATVMAMNNVYYRFTHLASNPAYATRPAKLRMSSIGNPGVARADFELWSLAVSAINGCGRCIDAHEQVLREAGVGEEAIQAAVRVAAVVASLAVALESVRAAA
ncbi:alkylhydroperoxidase, AhpD family [Methylobacterium sp. 4-46]|uniref:Alkyl hydroperoxide reductase AhpD n=1 Tax=Methylobacterium sp. (strain 4-46) TaxID=426117 RepID=AHPD_METS4|nr:MULTISPECIES: carboxymuconolactone decarboxylase family protein [Methylobacterium]B0UAJ8.1 RecName: Full=Alkyl hydroperoxide reductase AhpD; AltName: Full=Alkylhydroperoxidase AhpD [Methylobacterium sp. 4-46]ACA17913.1 alkylhydroperoxidase, AhpD family [Methylobacterium sp. 4-46]WFT77214.1 carboxymuconolactone decarboxylase family protein [Methylobacterium nodulans]